eukprot:1096319-Pelagomonas_calceolata.AAC.1
MAPKPQALLHVHNTGTMMSQSHRPGIGILLSLTAQPASTFLQPDYEVSVPLSTHVYAPLACRAFVCSRWYMQVPARPACLHFLAA